MAQSDQFNSNSGVLNDGSFYFVAKEPTELQTLKFNFICTDAVSYKYL